MRVARRGRRELVRAGHKPRPRESEVIDPFDRETSAASEVGYCECSVLVALDLDYRSPQWPPVAKESLNAPCRRHRVGNRDQRMTVGGKEGPALREEARIIINILEHTRCNHQPGGSRKRTQSFTGQWKSILAKRCWDAFRSEAGAREAEHFCGPVNREHREAGLGADDREVAVPAAKIDGRVACRASADLRDLAFEEKHAVPEVDPRSRPRGVPRRVVIKERDGVSIALTSNAVTESTHRCDPGVRREVM